MFFRYSLFSIGWAGIIFILILMPGKQMPDTGNLFSFDKLAHFGVFSLLSFLMIIGFAKQSTFLNLKKKHAVFGVVISLVYASLLELTQAIIPDRQMNFQDLIANTTGVLFGFLLFLLIYKIQIR